MEKEWFKVWFDSPLYQLLQLHSNGQQNRHFTDKLIAFLQPLPGASILDAACKRGEIAKYIASKGFDVTGLDLLPDSIEAAKGLENNNLHFFEHDLRLPYAANLYDNCFHLFTPFGYHRTQRENENALRTMAQALQPGGKLVIDCVNAAYLTSNLPALEEVTIQNFHFSISSRVDEHLWYKTIEVKEAGLTKTDSFTEKVYLYSLNDFTVMLQKQNMQIQTVFGDYNLAEYKEEQSPQMIIIAERTTTQ